MKSNGPRQEPCGIPHVTGRELDLLPFIDAIFLTVFEV